MAEPAQRRTDADGRKFYEHPFRTEPDPDRPGMQRPAQYLSVTQALDSVNKDALKFWSAGLAARRAMENLPKLLGAVLIPDCGRAAARTEPYGCSVCEACVQRWVSLFHVGETARRAREGTAAHDVLETWTKTGEWIYRPVLTGDPDVDQYVPTQDTMAPYIASLQAFVQDFGLKPESWVVCECTVYHHTLKYAGTLDGIVDIWPVTKKAADFWARIARYGGVPADQPVRVIIDAKSAEKSKEDAAFYPEHSLQQAPYRNAETMLPKGAAPEMETAMLATDGAAILQIRPDGCTLRPVMAGGNEMKAFRGVLDLARWELEYGARATQVGTFPLPDGWPTPKNLTWERATPPTGGLCGCAGCDDPADGRCLFGGRRPIGAHTREVDREGAPVAPPVAPVKTARKRAAKKAAPVPAAAKARTGTPVSPLLGSLAGHRPGGEIRDEDIPF